MHTINKKIINRIYGHGKGWCFTPKNFIDLGSPEAVRLTLHRLWKKGTIRRLAQGLYEYPRIHPSLGILSPKPEKIVTALCLRNSTNYLPSGAYSANKLGLSEHIPAKIIFLTDGISRQIKIGNQEIKLKKTSPRYLAKGKSSGSVIMALKHIGKKQISEQHIEHLTRTLSQTTKKQLEKDKIYAPNWMLPTINEIIKDTHA